MKIRAVNPGAAVAVLVQTVSAATSRSFALVVVSGPASAVALLPTAAELPSSGLTVSTPLYSRILTSTSGAAALSLTVTVLPFAAAATMFFA